MSEESSPFDHSRLSAQDLAVVRAFLATNEFATQRPDSNEASETLTVPSTDPELDSEEEMLIVFTTEVGEDLLMLRDGLEQAERDEHAGSPGFRDMRQMAHKIRGSAAMLGCDALSTIAHHIETLIQHITTGRVAVLTGIYCLGQAVGALEMTLDSVAKQGQEDISPLLALEQDLERQHISLAEQSDEQGMPTQDSLDAIERAFSPLHEHDRQQFDQIIQHTEKLIEQQTPLEHARAQVKAAFQELHAAQARLRRIESFFSSMFMPKTTAAPAAVDTGVTPSSSLVARILHEATQRSGHTHLARTTVKPEPFSLEDVARWDELEMERFDETNLLAHALNEANGDIATSTAQLQRALAHLDTLIGQHVTTAQQVRASALALRLSPFRSLAQHARQLIQQIAQDCQRELRFEVVGEAVEIDQHTLEVVDAIIIPVISLQFAESLSAHENDGQVCHVHLGACIQGNEVMIEADFSVSMPAETLDMVREVIQPLHGAVMMQFKQAGGVTFRLRFPRTSGLMHGLLARVREQQVIIPFSQVLRIDYQRQSEYDHFYTLNTLLDFPTTPPVTRSQIHPVLYLNSDEENEPATQVAVQVDGIIGQIELLLKPPPVPLRRPGVTGMAIDSTGNVLLAVDVLELIRQSKLQQAQASTSATATEIGRARTMLQKINGRPKILIVDDSVTIRRTIRQTLSQKDYLILEASDGLEALEKIEQESPHMLLLDLEMPRMNGYEVLNILRTRSLLPTLKIALLTSRASDKHRRRARDLGAHEFLTKPCSESTLLETVKTLLQI